MNKIILLSALFLGFLSVILGAVGSHLLEDYLVSIDRSDTFETAVRYQFYHVFLLLFISLFSDSLKANHIKYSFYCIFLGILVFSGSLYALCITNNPLFGAVTPIGGLLLILGWFFLFFSVLYSKKI
tara:strand:+ start:349 stop:729 length:381 start_codon:yes stop_codon:yes gene_type:complete